MTRLEAKTVAEVARKNDETAKVSNKYGIGYCCSGSENIRSAAATAKIGFQDLENDILKTKSTESFLGASGFYDLQVLIDHLILKHHIYLKETIPILKQYALVVVQAHSENNPELIQVQRLLSIVVRQLRGQMRKEELNIFPFIEEVLRTKEKGTEISRSKMDILLILLKAIKSELREAGAIFRQIRILSNNFNPPEGACNTYRTFYSKLDRFQKELQEGAHLKSNILYTQILQPEMV